MFRPINAIFGSKNAQKIYPEKTAEKPESVSQRSNTTSTSMSSLSTIDNNLRDIHQIDIHYADADANAYSDPCNAIYTRCKDSSAYDSLRCKS